MADISTTSWTETDGGNVYTPPLGWPAGMFPNAVEPTAQAMMGALKRMWNRSNPVYGATLTTTDSFTLSPSVALTGYGLYELWRARFPSANITTSPTLVISSLAAQPIFKFNTSASLINLAVGDIQAQAHEFYWDGSHIVLEDPAQLPQGAQGVTAVAVVNNTSGGIVTSGGPITTAGQIGIGLAPSTLPTKASPTSSDSVIVMDGAAASAPKTSLISGLQSIAGWTPPSTTKFTSAQQTGTTIIVAHTLGVIPFDYGCLIHNTIAEHNWNVGDETPIGPPNVSSSGTGVQMAADSTNVTVLVSGNGVLILDKSTRAPFVINTSNWTYVVHAKP